MLLNGDLTTKQDFRAKRKQLKLLDSRKRHVHVQVGHAENSLSNLLEQPSIEEAEEVEEIVEGSFDSGLLTDLVKRLDDASKERIRLAEEVQQLRVPIDILAVEIDRLQENLDEAEAALISSFLGESERESNLAIHKLFQRMAFVLPAEPVSATFRRRREKMTGEGTAFSVPRTFRRVLIRI